MSWDQIVEAIRQFWNQPVPIIGFTVGAVLLAILGIIAKTSIGKKQLNKLKIEINIERDRYAELQKFYESKLQIAEKNKELERQFIYEICENINNVNVKSICEKYKSQFENITYDQVVEDAKAQAIKEYEDKYKAELTTFIESEKERIKSELEEVKNVGKEE